MVRRSPPRKIRHSLWRKLLRRRRRVHAAPAQVSQRRKLAQTSRKKPQKVRRRRSACEAMRSSQAVATPVPWYVQVSRCSIILFGVATISGTVMSIIKPPATQIAATDQAKNLPVNSPTKKENIALKQSLQAVIAKYPNLQPHLLIVDPAGGSVDLAGAAVVPAASTINIPILIALFQQIDRGEIKLDEQLTLQKNLITSGAGSLAKSSIGSRFSVQEVATKMIAMSDPTATNMLIERLGGSEKLNSQFRRWGLMQTTIRSPLPDVAGTNVTNPRELLALLAGLKVDSKILSTASRQSVLAILRQTKRNTLLVTGVDDDKVKIAHQYGEISTWVAAAGLVELSNGQSYTVVAMIQRPPDDQRAELLIKQVSEVVYQAVTKK